jgi:hypothetical protein
MDIGKDVDQVMMSTNTTSHAQYAFDVQDVKVGESVRFWAGQSSDQTLQQLSKDYVEVQKIRWLGKQSHKAPEDDGHSDINSESNTHSNEATTEAPQKEESGTQFAPFGTGLRNLGGKI